MGSLDAYLPVDRRQAMLRGEDLPDRVRGAVLSADISGFTPLAEALAEELGPSRGAEELTRCLHRVYEALIAEVHQHRGSVIGFSGDAITCWFGDDDGFNAAACALALQQAMGQFVRVTTPSGATVSLAIRESVVSGAVRRFRVGDPAIQYIDVLAGAMMDRLAETEKQARKGEIVLDAETAGHLLNSVNVEGRETGLGQRIAVVTGLKVPVTITPWPDLPLGQMEDLEARDFIRRETSHPRVVYVFRHHITQEVVYNTMLEEQRRDLHRAVGQALERLLPDAVERLAYHYSRSDMREKALLYLDRAARKMQQEYANEMALDYYNQALSLERRWEWLKGKVEVLHILGQREEEKATLRLLRETSEAPLFDVAYLEGQYYEAIGDYTRAQAAIKQALEAARTRKDTAREARCLAQLGLIARRQGDYENAITWYTRAQRLLRSESIHSEGTRFLIQVVNDLGTIHRQRGEYEEAENCYQQALALSRASDNRREEARALDGLGTVAFHRRRFSEAVSYHHQALEVERAIGDRSGEGTSLLNLAMAIREAGDYGQAEEYLSEALSIQQAIGNRWEEINVWNELGILHLLEGDLHLARNCFERGLELSQAIGDEAGRAYILCNVGQVVRDEGDWETAERYLTESLSLAQQQGDRDLCAMCLSHLALTSLRAGRFVQAMEQASAALTMRNEVGLRLLTTIDWATLAEAHLALGHAEEAAACARQALSILQECGGVGPEFPYSDYFRCYHVLLATGYEEKALLALRCACELLMDRADKITDRVRRRSFLERPEHREIVREYLEGIGKQRG